MSSFVPSTWLVCALALASMQAQAGNDFNSSRSNRERGNLVSPPASSSMAQDFNTTRNNKERGASLKRVHGDPHVDQTKSAVDDPAAKSGKTGHVTLMK